MLGPLKGYVLRYCESDKSLQRFCQYLATLIPCEPTGHWGRGFLLEELDDLFGKIANGKLPKFMDALQYFVGNWVQSDDLEDLNELFALHNFGYQISYNILYGAEWSLREEPHQVNKSIADAIEAVEDISAQAKRHLEQAKEHLNNAHDDRSRKDALRDAMSAMESSIKKAAIFFSLKQEG